VENGQTFVRSAEAVASPEQQADDHRALAVLDQFGDLLVVPRDFSAAAPLARGAGRRS